MTDHSDIIFPKTAPESPLDPFGIRVPPTRINDHPIRKLSMASNLNSSHRENQAVHTSLDWDSPFSDPDVTWVNGNTKPLRVRKRNVVKPKIIPLSDDDLRRHRFTALSFPQSPESPSILLSPTKPRLERTPSSKSDTSSAHRAISNLFLSTPPSPSPTSPFAALTRRVVEEAENVETTKHRSSLHLGLGLFDTVVGPCMISPPDTPSPNPYKYYTFSTKPLPQAPVPMTPTRAPRKAAALLGTSTPPLPHGIQKKNEKRALTGKHFRPLPGSTLAEIERFFGELPRRSKPKRSNPPSSFQSPGIGAATMQGEVGKGETVRYRDENGRLWMDVEEEQEFAWLMSELANSLLPGSNHDLPDLTPDITSSEDDQYESEDAFDMERFTSVLALSLPRPQPPGKAGGSSKKADKILGISRGKVENSWLDLGMDRPLPTITRSIQHVTPERRTVSDNHLEEIPHPWSRTTLTSNPTPLALLSAKPYSKEREIAGQVIPTRASSRIVSDSEIINGIGKEKKRPPPLVLRPQIPKRGLPILIPTTPPNDSIQESSKVPGAPKIPQVARFEPPLLVPKPSSLNSSIAPTTPFLHPRPAPVPAPPLPGTALPKPKPSLVILSNPDISVLGSTSNRPSIDYPGSEVEEREPVSWFEAATPIDSQGEGSKLIQALTVRQGRKVSHGTTWLKKITNQTGRK